MAKNQEVEIKLPLRQSVASMRRKLQALGFRVEQSRILERNTVFDTEGLTLREKSELLRLRRYGSRRVLTYKGPPIPGKHKSREELEIEASDDNQLALILSRLGYRPAFRYEKYRTEFAPAKGHGALTLDETPVGNYLEIEGTAAWIDRTARLLGFSEADYNTKSYGTLYLEFCRERGIEPGDMLFKRPAKA